MLTRHAQVKLPQLSPTIGHYKSAQHERTFSNTVAAQVADVEVGVISPPVGHRAPGDRRQQPPQLIIVVAGHHHAIKRQTIHEFQKCLMDVVHIAIAVQVFTVDVGHDGENRRKF